MIRKWLTKFLEPIILNILKKYGYFDMAENIFPLSEQKKINDRWNNLYKESNYLTSK
jgi:hypothetical protein